MGGMEAHVSVKPSSGLHFFGFDPILVYTSSVSIPLETFVSILPSSEAPVAKGAVTGIPLSDGMGL